MMTVVVFKLYLYGIEIKTEVAIALWRIRFKLYLYGIEIHYLYYQDDPAEVQIVPLWN